MVAKDHAITKMIIILTLSSMRLPLAHSAGVCVALALGAGVVPASAAQPVLVAVDGTLCDLTKTLAAAAASVKCLEDTHSLSRSLLQGRTITGSQKRCQRTGYDPHHCSGIGRIVPDVGITAAIGRQGDFTDRHHRSR